MCQLLSPPQLLSSTRMCQSNLDYYYYYLNVLKLNYKFCKNNKKFKSIKPIKPIDNNKYHRSSWQSVWLFLLLVVVPLVGSSKNHLINATNITRATTIFNKNQTNSSAQQIYNSQTTEPFRNSNKSNSSHSLTSLLLLSPNLYLSQPTLAKQLFHNETDNNFRDFPLTSIYPRPLFSHHHSHSHYHHKLHSISKRDSSNLFYELQSSSSLLSGLSSISTQHQHPQQHLAQQYHQLSQPSPPDAAPLSLPQSTLQYLPQFSQEPYGSLKFSNQYGGIVPCSVRLLTQHGSAHHQSSIQQQSPGDGTTGTGGLWTKVHWEVRDFRTIDDSHFTPVVDIVGLREQRSDGSLAFLPFQHESLLNNPELHNALYRCVVQTSVGTLLSRTIHVTLTFEKSGQVVARSYDATTSDGNDALLKCSVNSDLYRVVAWLSDDGELFLPFDHNTNFIPLDIRHYVLPSGDLLIASVRNSDVRRQFRCRVGHLLTGERLDSSNWARIKLTDQSSHISYRPRFNLDTSLRQTLAIDDIDGDYSDSNGDQNRASTSGLSGLNAVDLYCSFDGQPPPNISWYFIGYQDSSGGTMRNNNNQGDVSQNRPSPVWFNITAPNLHSGSMQTTDLRHRRIVVTTRHLRILHPTSADIGTYVCVGNNSHFEVRHETDLLLRSLLQVNLTTIVNRGRSSSTSSSTQQSSSITSSASASSGRTPQVPLLPGDQVTLVCNLTHLLDGSTVDQVINSRFIVTYHWYHNQVPIADSSDLSNSNPHYGHQMSAQSSYQDKRQTSYILNPLRYYNSYLYSSGGSSPGGASSSSSSSSSSLHIEKLEQNVIQIRNLRHSDTGIYQCFVRLTGPDYQEWLQASTVIQLTQRAPSFFATFDEQILIADNELSLKCVAGGNPAPAIIWQRNGVNLTDFMGNLITTHSGSGSSINGNIYRYKTASYLAKESKMFNQVDLGQIKSTTSNNNRPQQQQSESQLSPHHQHHLSDNFVTVSYFNISSIRPQDVGLFRCTASNGAGVASHQARISVIGSPYAQPIGDVTAVVGESVTITCPYGGYPIEEVFFLKAKRRLPYDERHLITALGSLTIVQVEKNDEDEYSCVVVGGGNGQRSEQSFRLSVVSPPVLSPFIFSDALEEGMRATAVCSVISGDPPIQLQWLKDGEPLSQLSMSGQSSLRRADPHIQVLNIKEFISSLIITNITRRHQGWYTCFASTPSTSSNRTALMKVKAPPKWLIKPSNQFAITQSIGTGLNQSTTSGGSASHEIEHVTTTSATINSGATVRFDCLATGNPTPVIRWKFLRPKSPPGKSSSSSHISSSSSMQLSDQYDSVPILSSPQIHVLENGSLLIRSLDKAKFEGIYLCEVANGIGKPLEARASLIIHSTPHISLKISAHSSSSSSSSSSNDQSGDSKHYHTGSAVTNLPEENTVQLSLRRHSQVSLACSASGMVPLSISWYKNDREINSFESVSISSTNSFRILESSLKTKSQHTYGSTSSGIMAEHKIGERTTNLILKHLTRSDNGRYVCVTRNLYGVSLQRVVVYVLEPPDAPESLKAIEVGSRSVTLSWQVIYTGNLPIISQNIEYKQESEKTWHNALTIKSNTNTINVYGLQPLSPYEFRVSFVNELGTSDHSRSITLTTQMEAPTVMPDNLRATALSTHTIRLTWSLRMPSQNTDIEVIDGFYIGYRAISSQGSQSSSSASSSASSSSYTYKTISNTPMQHLYSKLSNSGSGINQHKPMLYRSKSTSSSSFSGVSTASFLIKLQNQSDQPNSIGQYPMERSGSSVLSSSSLGLPTSSLHQYYEHSISSLQRQTQYQFVVQAFNEKGAGPASLEVIARTFTHDPPKPPMFRVENVSAHEASLSWEYTENSNINLMHSSSSSSAISSSLTSSLDSPPSSSINDSPLLVDGYVISYHVAFNQISNHRYSDNMMDSSVSSGHSSLSSNSGVPMQDSSSSVSSSSNNNNNNAIDDWQSITISSPSTSSFVLRNLLCGTEYTARIEAFNKMGSGKPSEQIRFSTVGSVPSAPEKFSRQFIATNITYVTINLDQWSDGGCPISGYSIKYRSRKMSHYHRSVSSNGATGNSGGWIPLSTHLMPEKDSIIIRDLQPGTWHDLVIVAQNDAGRTEAEFSFATLTETGATVEPLHAFESRMGSSFGSASAGYGNGSVLGALFEDPMIFIPALCTVIVLLVVSSTSAFLYVMRIRHEAMQLANSEDTYCSHRSANSRSDDLSLNSYSNNNNNNNNGCGGGGATIGKGQFCSSNNNNGHTLANGKGATILYDMKGISMESASEPLYEQTTNFVHSNQNHKTMSSSSYHQQQQQLAQQQQQQQQLAQNSPRKTAIAANHHLATLQQKQLSSENLLDYHQLNNTYGFAPSGGANAMFCDLQDSSNSNFSAKTLGRQPHHSQHLYQVPEQIKLDSIQSQQQQSTQLLSLGDTQQAGPQPHSMMSIDSGPQTTSGSGPIKLANSYMTTFGMIRAMQNHGDDFIG